MSKYWTKEEVKFFKKAEMELKNFLLVGDLVNVVKPCEYTTERANTPSGFDLFEREGARYRCVVGEDKYGNLTAENCTLVSGSEHGVENGDLLRHLVGAEFLVNKVTGELK